jgi:hypothetical protein
MVLGTIRYGWRQTSRLWFQEKIVDFAVGLAEALGVLLAFTIVSAIVAVLWAGWISF